MEEKMGELPPNTVYNAEFTVNYGNFLKRKKKQF